MVLLPEKKVWNSLSVFQKRFHGFEKCHNPHLFMVSNSYKVILKTAYLIFALNTIFVKSLSVFLAALFTVCHRTAAWLFPRMCSSPLSSPHRMCVCVP